MKHVLSELFFPEFNEHRPLLEKLLYNYSHVILSQRDDYDLINGAVEKIKVIFYREVDDLYPKCPTLIHPSDTEFTSLLSLNFSDYYPPEGSPERRCFVFLTAK